MKSILKILLSTLRIKKKHFKKNQYGIDYLFNEHYLKTIPQIMIFMRLESFLMNVEVMFYLKKQRELEKNSIKKRLFIIL